ncbi:hypothetical protein IFM89_023140 [Coptis chinensis]|uniref:Uncharacterized protein n=1 Tax=Coptis chinensis TaxID=261450 RepID=A0A835H6Z7_9MAGN|nr:hypothetical protein IFM89_023140 [Coptis chinensis]
MGQFTYSNIKRLSIPLLPKHICDDILMEYGALKVVTSGLGTDVVIMVDKLTDIVDATASLSYFYKHENCGQCHLTGKGQAGWL